MIALRKSFSLEMIKEYEMVWENSKNDLGIRLYNFNLNFIIIFFLFQYSFVPMKYIIVI